jgi:filamentous hemagglutinin
MAANGTPVVNINKPNAAGLSNNTYSSFNVGGSNLILNNANKIVTTGTGGVISGNPNLSASGPASVILTGATVNLSFGNLAGMATTTNSSGATSSNISATNTLDLNFSGNFDNPSGQEIVAANNLTLSVSGSITNEGTITASGTTTIIGAGITNTGAIFGAQVKVDDTGYSIVNDGSSAVIGAVNDLGVYTNGNIQNSNGAYLYSQGTLEIAGQGGQGSANSLLNSSATIEANGDISISASTVTNQRTTLVYTTALGDSYYEGIGDIYFPFPQNLTAYIYCDSPPGCASGEQLLYYIGSTTTITQDSGSAVITSGGNLTITGNSITNAYSVLSAAGNITINGGGIASTTDSATIGSFTNISLAASTDGFGAVAFEPNDTIDPPNVLNIVTNNDPSDPIFAQVEAKIGTQPPLNPPPTSTGTDSAAPAIVAAGGSVSITAQTINNQNLQAAGNIDIAAASLTSSQTLNTVTDHSGFFSSTITTTHDQIDSTTLAASNVSGNVVNSVNRYRHCRAELSRCGKYFG